MDQAFSGSSSLRRCFYIGIAITATVIGLLWIFSQGSNQLPLMIGKLSEIYQYVSNVTVSPLRYCYIANNSTIVFIHLTNKTDHWQPMEMCAFKSAAILNNDVGVCVLTRYPMKPHKDLVDIPNIEVAPLDIDIVLNDTPLATWYEDGRINESDIYYVAQLSDALRYAYLYNYGGRYMDSDVLTLRPFGSLQNVIGWEHDTAIGTAVLFLSKRHPLLEEILKRFTGSYEPGQWGSVGPPLITSVHSEGIVDKSTYTVMQQNVFFAIPYYEFQLLFQPDDAKRVRILVNDSYTVHLYRKMWAWRNGLDTFHSPPKGSFVYEYKQQVCPDGSDNHSLPEIGS